MFVGRTAERARIDRLLSDVRAGCGAALTIRGAPRIGKSRLLADACDRADGMQVLSTFGVESESELPFAALNTHASCGRAPTAPQPGAS